MRRDEMVRYLAILPYAILCIMAITIAKNETVGSLIGVAIALYLILGYLCRWKHVYCFWQSTFRSKKMTPKKIEWSKIGKMYYIGLPMCLLLLNLTLLGFEIFGKYVR